MKSKQKVAILVWHRASKPRKKDGKAPIYIRITIEGQDEEIGAGWYTHPDYWDVSSKGVRPEDENHIEINSYVK